LGKAFALAFAREGAMVTVAARTVQRTRFIAGPYMKLQIKLPLQAEKC